MPKLRNVLDVLKSTELFAQAPDLLCASLAEKMEYISVPAGEILFGEGEHGDALYLIAEGEVEVLSNEVNIISRGPGECIGELALLDDLPRSATVVAKTDARLLKLLREDFQQALANSFEVAQAALQTLGRKLRQDIKLWTAAARAHERIQHDLRRARELQMSMLPSEDLALDWLYLTGESRPATEVGGDYYAYSLLPDGRVAIAVGDATGHGFYSGLLVAMVSSVLQFQIEIDPSPEAVLAALNRVVYNYRHKRLLLTFAYGLLAPKQRILTLASAGHPYPYLYQHRQNKWIPLTINSLPLGTKRQLNAPEIISVEWEPGDKLFLYSDGVTDMSNEHGEIYSFDSLEQALHRHATKTPSELKEAIYKELCAYRGKRPVEDEFDDDVTIVVVEFVSP